MGQRCGKEEKDENGAGGQKKKCKQLQLQDPPTSHVLGSPSGHKSVQGDDMDLIKSMFKQLP